MTTCDECHGTGVLHGYGFFPGGDPTMFTPDPERSTEGEREAHRMACERGGDVPAVTLVDGVLAHARYGLGAYTYPCWCVRA